MKVFVYFNLHKKVWRVKALSGEHKGRVIGHAETVLLKSCEFRVSKAGRQRVLKERRKNVHAGVVGILLAMDGKMVFDYAKSVPVTYNPYKYETFVNKTTEEPVTHSDTCLMMSQSRTVLAA